MATVQLLWFFVWRMALLGAVLGAVSGMVYGATLMFASLIVQCLMDLAACFGGTVNPIGGAPYFAAFGAGFGLLFGVLAGPALGLVDGLFLGVLTRLFYHPPTDGARYRKAAGTICGATGLLFLFTAWAVAGFDPTTFIVPVFTPSFFSRAWLDLVFITFIPTMAATLAMWWAGRKVGESYAAKFRQL